MPHEDQFTATGPPFDGAGFPNAAFSTNREGLSTSPYGVNVQGSECGVYAESGFDSSSPRHVPASHRDTENVGVCGLGRTYGVVGVGSQIAGVYGERKTTVVRSGAGVMGVAPKDGSGSVGIGVVGATANNDIGVLGISVDDIIHGEGGFPLIAKGSATGVAGESGSGTGVVGRSTDGSGIIGMSKSSTTLKDIKDSEISGGVIGIINYSLKLKDEIDSRIPAGVIGISEKDAGVFGHGSIGVTGLGTRSPDGIGGRGGVFESDQIAQVKLTPLFNLSRLPCEGEAGDLLVVSPLEKGKEPPDKSFKHYASLYFCVRSQTRELGPALWGRVIFDGLFTCDGPAVPVPPNTPIRKE